MMEVLRNLIDASLLGGSRAEIVLRDLRNRLKVEPGAENSLLKGCRTFANARFNGLAQWLEENYPSLNRDEILHCCIISLGLPSDNLRFLLGHENVNSIYNRNSRIRRKLGIARSGLHLDEFLYELTLELEKEEAERDYFQLQKKTSTFVSI